MSVIFFMKCNINNIVNIWLATSTILDPIINIRGVTCKFGLVYFNLIYDYLSYITWGPEAAMSSSANAFRSVFLPVEDPEWQGLSLQLLHIKCANVFRLWLYSLLKISEGYSWILDIPITLELLYFLLTQNQSCISSFYLLMTHILFIRSIISCVYLFISGCCLPMSLTLASTSTSRSCFW